jgi:hypothetical protein
MRVSDDLEQKARFRFSFLTVIEQHALAKQMLG